MFDAWNKTVEIAEALNATTIVFQCPGSFKQSEYNVYNMREFFGEIKNNQKKSYLFAWEPRGGWGEETIKNLCEELDLIHCVDPMVNKSVYGEPKYYRLHGGGDYRHKYTDSELKWLAQITGDDCYFLFNNMNMFEDALRFKERLANERV